MADPNRALFESVVRLLAPVLDDLVFVGGCTTGLFITDPAAAGAAGFLHDRRGRVLQGCVASNRPAIPRAVQPPSESLDDGVRQPVISFAWLGRRSRPAEAHAKRERRLAGT